MDDFKEYNCSVCNFSTDNPTEYLRHLFLEHDGILDTWREYYQDNDTAKRTIGMLGL